jgi:hypothetical protein
MHVHILHGVLALHFAKVNKLSYNFSKVHHLHGFLALHFAKVNKLSYNFSKVQGEDSMKIVYMHYNT